MPVTAHMWISLVDQPLEPPHIYTIGSFNVSIYPQLHRYSKRGVYSFISQQGSLYCCLVSTHYSRFRSHSLGECSSQRDDVSLIKLFTIPVYQYLIPILDIAGQQHFLNGLTLLILLSDKNIPCRDSKRIRHRLSTLYKQIPFRLIDIKYGNDKDFTKFVDEK